jgi:hypothetical protein
MVTKEEALAALTHLRNCDEASNCCNKRCDLIADYIVATTAGTSVRVIDIIKHNNGGILSTSLIGEGCRIITAGAVGMKPGQRGTLTWTPDEEGEQATPDAPEPTPSVKKAKNELDYLCKLANEETCLGAGVSRARTIITGALESGEESKRNLAEAMAVERRWKERHPDPESEYITALLQEIEALEKSRQQAIENTRILTEALEAKQNEPTPSQAQALADILILNENVAALQRDNPRVVEAAKRLCAYIRGTRPRQREGDDG